MRSITCQKNASALELVRDVRSSLPRHDVFNRDRNIIRAERNPYKFFASLFSEACGDVRDRFLRITQCIDRQKSRIEWFLKSEETAQHGVIDVNHTEVPASEQRSDIGTKVNRHAVRERAAPAHRNSQPLANAAVRAIGRHHVTCPYGQDFVRVTFANDGGNTVRVLLE